MPIEQYNNECWLEIVLNQTTKDGSIRRIEKSFKNAFEGWSWYQRMRPSFAKKKQPSQGKDKKKKGIKDDNLVQTDGFASYGEPEPQTDDTNVPAATEKI
jgi:transposase